MVAKDEFDQRVGQAFAARTQAELAALTADLPVQPVAARSPGPVRDQGEQPVLRTGPMLAGATALYACMWAVAVLWPVSSEGDRPDAVIVVLFSATIVYLFVLVIAAGAAITGWCEKRSGGRPPRRPAPGTGGQASRRPPSAGPGGQLRPAGHGQQHIAEAGRSDPAQLRSPGSRPAHQRRHRGHRFTIGYAGQ
jgi:hypothetical protein